MNAKRIEKEDREKLYKQGAVGVVDNLGYLRCMACAVNHGNVVWGDTGPHNTEKCDVCDQPVDPA